METQANTKPFLTRAESADYLTEKGYKTAAGTLQKLASIGGGPEYQIYGRDALYKPENLINWATARLSKPRRSTSGQGGAA